MNIPHTYNPCNGIYNPCRKQNREGKCVSDPITLPNSPLCWSESERPCAHSAQSQNKRMPSSMTALQARPRQGLAGFESLNPHRKGATHRAWAAERGDAELMSRILSTLRARGAWNIWAQAGRHICAVTKLRSPPWRLSATHFNNMVTKAARAWDKLVISLSLLLHRSSGAQCGRGSLLLSLRLPLVCWGKAQSGFSPSVSRHFVKKRTIPPPSTA